MPDIVAVVVSYGSLAQLAQLLPTLRAPTATLRVAVANNLVGDDLSAVVGDAIELLEMGGNLGYGAAINRTVELTGAGADWVLVVNPDVTFEPGAIDELLRVGESDPSIGAVGPQILTALGEVYPSARRLPSLRTGVGHALLSRAWRGNPWTHRYLSDRELPPRQRDAGWLSGACVLVRARVFTELGGFDDDFFMYFEDVDLGRRIARAGYRNVYAPSATITHTGAHATSSSGRVMIRAHHRSAYRYMARKYSGWYLFPLRLTLRLGLAIRARLVRG